MQHEFILLGYAVRYILNYILARLNCKRRNGDVDE